VAAQNTVAVFEVCTLHAGHNGISVQLAKLPACLIVIHMDVPYMLCT